MKAQKFKLMVFKYERTYPSYYVCRSLGSRCFIEASGGPAQQNTSAVAVCAHCPDSGHFGDVSAWGRPHEASFGTKECSGELGYCNKFSPEVLLSLKSAFHMNM